MNDCRVPFLGKTVAMSTCEAEVDSAMSAAKDAPHLKGMLVEMGYASPDAPLQIGEDKIQHALLKLSQVFVMFAMLSI